MALDSKIEWTDATFNPWRGCVKVSAGCDLCYAESWAKRTGKKIWGPLAGREMASPRYWKFPVQWNLEAAASGRQVLVFCASLADVCEDREDLVAPRVRLIRLIEATPALTWLLLTKRPENFNRLFGAQWSAGRWPKNVWAMTTAENQATANKRIPELLKVPAAVRGVSYEPALGLVNFMPWLMRSSVCCDAVGMQADWCPCCDRPAKARPRLDWVIMGGESGVRARPLHPEWIRDVRGQCSAAGVAFHFKQWGQYEYLPVMVEHARGGLHFTGEWRTKNVGKKKAGRVFEGRTWDEFPKETSTPAP